MPNAVPTSQWSDATGSQVSKSPDAISVDAGKLPKQIDWGSIKSMRVEDHNLCVVYDGGRQVVHTFRSKLELLRVLENRRDRK